MVDDDLDEEEAIMVTEKKNLENDIEDETLEIDKVVNIKESRNHPLENIIGNLNQITLRSQAQNQSNFICFISTIAPKNVNKALGDESWIVAMQEELNQFIANDSHTKHIKIGHNFLRDNVQKGHISTEKVPSVDNIADILTKPLKREMTLEEELRYTKSYVPTIFVENYLPETLKPFIQNLKCRSIHEVMKIPLLEYFATVSAKEFPLLVYFATVSAKEFPLLSYRVAPAEEFALLIEDQINININAD
nr:Gag-Pol polyprotein [Tanacetum cinerariifolium]